MAGAGGDFTQSGTISVNRIAFLNNGIWKQLGSGVDNNCNILAFDSEGNLYAGGEFTNAGDVVVNHIARYGNDIINLLVNNETVDTIEYEQTKIILISNNTGYSLTFNN